MTRRQVSWTVLFLLAVSGSIVPASESQALSPPAAAQATADELSGGFQSPPVTSKPWAYWWWVSGNVTEQSIRRDIAEMKAKGFGGLLMFDARGYHDDHTPPPPSPMEFMSPEWRRLLKLGIEEAARHGLTVSVNLSSCAGALRGPWLVGSDSPRELRWTSRDVAGGGRVDCLLADDSWLNPADIALFAVRLKTGAPQSTAVRQSDVLQLTVPVEPSGRLKWTAPEGRWRLVRFVSSQIAGHERDVDILSAEAVARYFDRMGRQIVSDVGPLAGKTLTHFYSVSWEGAAPTWTPGLEQHFRQRRGYSMMPYLPVLAGVVIESDDVCERFLRDYHKTLGDLFRDHCYGTLRRLCHQCGLKWHSESGGPWTRSLPTLAHADQMAYLGRNDMPQGEFWYRGRAINRPAAMAAHIYGLPLAAAEAFTDMGPHWQGYPATLRLDADAAFADGINQLIWHTFTASPEEFGKPGLEYFAGTHLNPNVTWWEQSSGFLTYLARCQHLLRQGSPVVDVAVYTGDKPYLHWGRGEKWSDAATVSLPKGYSYDLINDEVLLERTAVVDGQIALDGGMRYRALIVDLEDERAEPAVLKQLTRLAQGGATLVLGNRRPSAAVGLKGYPERDDEVRRLADALWQLVKPDSSSGSESRRVFSAGEITEAFTAAGQVADFEGPWPYAHRQQGNVDIYFVAGSGSAECVFRVSGREPELWDAVTGHVRDALVYRPTADGRTMVPLDLGENGSVFVVFRRPAEPNHLVALSGSTGQGATTAGFEIARRDAEGFDVVLWRNAPVEFGTSNGGRRVVDVTSVPPGLELSGPWQVRFAAGWGAPESAQFDRLVAWNEHADPGIRYFSGTATYSRQFELSQQQASGPVRLDLGKLYHVAEIRLNGKPLGLVWTAPWAVDLTGKVKAGTNRLEIAVTNLWPNRLIGDAALPEAKRLTKTNAVRPPDYEGRLPHLRGYASSDPLVESGLLGPVRLQFGIKRRVPLPAMPR